MKKILLILLLFTPLTQAFSHYLWIETARNGVLNKLQIVQIKYGEYAYNEIEPATSEAFLKVKNFELWLVGPDGQKQSLKTVAQGDHYQAQFTPTQTGNYTVYLDHKKLEIVDSSQYNFGIYKPQYHAKAQILIGKVSEIGIPTNSEGLELVEVSSKKQELTFKVLYKNQPLIKNKVAVFFKDGWSKELETDNQGQITLVLPFPTAYTLEVIYIDKTVGTFNQIPYEFVWNCTSYYLDHTAVSK